MANYNSSRPSMMNIDDYRARAAARDGTTRLVMAALALIAALVIASMLYLAVALFDRGIGFMGDQMEAYADTQTGDPR